MASKWNGQPCPLCGAGTLHDGVKTITQNYKRRTFSSAMHGAFCDPCTDGFVEFDAAEEAAWLAFRDHVDAEETAELARELARVRKKLKLSQVEAAKLAGGGKNIFSR